MTHTTKANIYLLIMGTAMYALSLFAHGTQAHQWANLLQEGTYFCIGAIIFLFAWRFAIVLVTSRFNRTRRAAQPAAKAMPVANRRRVA